MAEFFTDLVARLNDDGETWILEKPLCYVSNIAIDGKYVIIVPEDFETDFASVPRLPLSYLTAGNTAHKAAVVHDYLYENGIGTKELADKIFLEAMEVSGIAAWRRTLMYWAVVLGGKGNFKPELEKETQ